MKNKKLHKYLAWLLVLAVVFSIGSTGNPAEIMAKSKKTAVIKSVSLKIGNKKVTKKTYKMKQGDRKKIKVNVSSKKGKKTIKFTSSSKKVATVNKNGRVTAKKAGTARITVTVRLKKTGKKGFSAKKSVWVKIKVTGPASPDKTNGTTVTEPPAAEPSVTEPPAQNPAGKKSIVVYFSCTDNTKTIAEYVAESAGADVYRIQPSVPYTSADLKWCRTLPMPVQWHFPQYPRWTRITDPRYYSTHSWLLPVSLPHHSYPRTNYWWCWIEWKPVQKYHGFHAAYLGWFG